MVRTREVFYLVSSGFFFIGTKREYGVGGVGMAWGVWDWNLSWRKGRFQWESELIQQLMEDLQGRSPILNKGDGWEWRSGKQKEYVVKEVYELLHEEGSQEDAGFFRKI